MIRFKGILLIFIIFLYSGLCAFSASYIVSFGDSLSDGANNGRYTDGALWVEVLAEKLNLPKPEPSVAGGFNFAHSGAMSGNDDAEDTLNVGNQIKVYLESNGGKADPEALYVIWVGGNDFLNGRSPDNLIENIANHIETLSGAGAKQFFIPNLPSLVHAPRGQKMIQEMVDITLRYLPGIFEGAVHAFVNSYVHGKIGSYNEQLEKRLKVIEEYLEGIVIHRLDVFSIFNEILENLDYHGFKEKSELFFDDLHPNAKGHELIADSASNVLKAEL